MKREKLELVRLGQGSVRHVCLPPDAILRSLLSSMSFQPDEGQKYVDSDARFLQRHRTLCGRYGTPNTEPYDVPGYGHHGVDPAFFPVCRTCAKALVELMPTEGHALNRALAKARRKPARTARGAR